MHQHNPGKEFELITTLNHFNNGLAHKKRMKKLFVIDDEAYLLISIKAWSKKKGYKVMTF